MTRINPERERGRERERGKRNLPGSATLSLPLSVPSDRLGRAGRGRGTLLFLHQATLNLPTFYDRLTASSVHQLSERCRARCSPPPPPPPPPSPFFLPPKRRGLRRSFPVPAPDGFSFVRRGSLTAIWKLSRDNRAAGGGNFPPNISLFPYLVLVESFEKGRREKRGSNFEGIIDDQRRSRERERKEENVRSWWIRMKFKRDWITRNGGPSYLPRND